MRAGHIVSVILTALGGAMLAASLNSAAAAEDLRARGAYLVTTIGSCGNCHTPRSPSGQPLAGMALAGGFSFDTHEPGIGVVTPPNITPDKETGIGNWSAAQIVDALRNGKRPDGTLIGPPMPIPMYRELSDRDAAAVAAYLLSLKPIRHAVPERNQYKIDLPADYGPPVTHVAEPKRDDKVAYGGYLATFGHCVLCHTPPGKEAPFDMSRAFAGGRDLPNFPNTSAVVVSRNITPDPDHGIGKWSDAQIKRAIVAGIRPDGTKLVRVMPFDWYAKMTPADLDDIVAYLRSLQPMK
jgi:mono/diheme cytochrome c family protein